MEEVPGDEEGVVAEVNQEGAKEEELQVKGVSLTSMNILTGH